MSHYLGRGVLVSDAVFGDIDYIKCPNCFMSYSFPVHPKRNMIQGDMEISILFENGPVIMKPGQSFRDLERLREYITMELFCRCGTTLRSWGPEDVNFNADEPEQDLAPMKDQVTGGIIPGILKAIALFFRIILEILFALV
ncbi:MAG: hypothetical protein ACMUHB_03835 [Thermoplasmatota archaeon]